MGDVQSCGLRGSAAAIHPAALPFFDDWTRSEIPCRVESDGQSAHVSLRSETPRILAVYPAIQRLTGCGVAGELDAYTGLIRH